MRAHDLITEIFDRPYPVKIFKDQAVARDERGMPLWIDFTRTPAWETVKVTFDRGKGFELTDWGNEFRIFATVVSAIQQWSTQYRPGSMYFSVENDEPNNRQRLYDRMVKKLAGSTDYELVTDPAQIGSDTVRYYAGLLGRRFSDARYWWLVRRDLFKPSTDDASQSESVEEGWRDVARAAALGTAVAAGGAAVYDQMKSARPVPVTAAPADKPFAVPRVTGSPLESFLARAAHAAGMRGTELAQFLAQAAHETGDFQHMRELGASRYFDRYEPRMVRMKKTGEVINANPRAQRLGNDQPGDGARYRGRGFLQITGRDNYRRLGAALNLPLEQQPELLEQPEIAARAALWFWKNRVVPRVQDFADTHAATRAINPALRGLEDRRAKFVEYVKQLRTDTNESQRHDQEWVDAVDRHVRLRAVAKREGDEAKFNYHNDAIKKLYGHDNPPVTPAGTFNDDPGGIEIDETLAETRDRMFDFIKQVLPKWPDYVLRDWIYQMARGEFKQGGWIAFGPKSSEQRYPSFSRESILALIKLEGLSPDTVWKFFPRFEFTMSGLDPSTRQKILARRGGTENPYGVQRDAERHATQAALAKQQGGIRQEPVIGKMTTDGFELIEGWHRTVQHFKMYPQGYYAPAWVAMNPRPVTENFADGKVKGKSRPGRVKRAGASCAGSVADLRQRAAKYGGERGKMYHWCANMKSGRKKK